MFFFYSMRVFSLFFFFFQAEDGIRDLTVTGFRRVLFRSSVGQPEVNLGLVPAGGGTQRLPRLVGLQRALDLILSGRRLNARRARRAGLLDEIVHASVLEQAARSWAAKPKRPLDRRLQLGLSVQTALDVAEQSPAG